MELFESGRILWRRRHLLAVATFVSLVLGILVSFHVSPTLPPLHSRAYMTGAASAQVLIDTPSSQIADLNPTGAPYVYEHASLLSNVMATAPVELAIAKQLKLSPDDLSVTPPAASIIAPLKATGLATSGTNVAQIKPSWSLSIAIDPNLPLLNFNTTAPTPADAKALAAAAITVLRSQVTGLAKLEDVPAGEQVVVKTIGPPVATAVAKGVRKLYGAVVSVFLLVVACFLIVLLDRRRARGADDEQHHQPLPEYVATEALALVDGTGGAALMRLSATRPSSTQSITGVVRSIQPADSSEDDAEAELDRERELRPAGEV